MARGFCGPHVSMILAVDRQHSGGMLGPSILLDAVIRIREAELVAVVGSTGWNRRRRLPEASRPAACPVCREAASAASVALRTLVRASADIAWSTALAAAEFCLEHLLGLMAVPSPPPGWATVERGQMSRVAHIRRQLRSFADHSSQDRRHLVTAEERAAVDLGAELLGSPRRARRP